MENRFRKDRVILYVSILLAYLIFWVHSDLATHPNQLYRAFINNFWQVLYVLGANHFYFEYMLPFVTSKKQYRVVWILASLILHLGIFMIGLYAWYSIGKAVGLYEPFQAVISSGQAFSDIARFTPGAFLLFAVFKLFFDYNRLRYEAQQVRLEKKQAELVFLKSQINPHFLFNTLNNIYSLSQQEPQLVSESVLRLSKILRYMLYETDKEFIFIEREIKALEDYIDLERLRYSENVTITFEHNMDNTAQKMPPLLLLPLVENAFKHGVSQSRGNRFVEVHFLVRNLQLLFAVRNSSHTAAVDREIKENIGLSNLKRRLTLLYKEFKLETVQKGSTFTAELTINLASHV